MSPLLLSLALLAAQDGGRLPWKGQGLDPVGPVIKEAMTEFRPMFLFFSSAGNEDCIALSKGAFSDPDVVRAADRVSCIFVECGSRKNAALAEALKVTTFPTLMFFSSDATPIGELKLRDAPSIAAAMRQVADQAVSLPHVTEDLDAALAHSKKTGLPALIYFYDASPPSLTMNRSLTAPELKPLRDRFVLARAEYRKGSDAAARFGVDRAPTLLVLNGRLTAPEDKPLARIATPRSAQELRRDLQEVLDALKADLAPGALPLPQAPEKLSDDELDRRFIRARINVAVEMLKADRVRDAVDALEDVVRTWPRHAETKEAKRLLDQIRNR